MNVSTLILDGTPGATRTHDTRFRKPLLYPLSYRGMKTKFLFISVFISGLSINFIFLAVSSSR